MHKRVNNTRWPVPELVKMKTWVDVRPVVQFLREKTNQQAMQTAVILPKEVVVKIKTAPVRMVEQVDF